MAVLICAVADCVVYAPIERGFEDVASDRRVLPRIGLIAARAVLDKVDPSVVGC